MDVDFSPTGREFVAGGYDRSVRIFPYNGGHSREVYHTKRMQRVFCTRFSGDATYIFSGSDDMNVRVWKVCFVYLLLPSAYSTVSIMRKDNNQVTITGDDAWFCMEERALILCDKLYRISRATTSSASIFTLIF